MKTIYISALSARSGGGITYLDKILPLFPSDLDVECHVVASTSFKLPADCGGNVFLHALPNWMNNPFIRFAFTKLYIRFFVFKGKKIDVIFFPGGSIDLPVFQNAKTIIAFRNMLPFNKKESSRYPCGYIRVRNWLLFLIQRASFREANFIIFISHYAKSIMKKYIDNVEEKSTVIYHGIDDNIMRTDKNYTVGDVPDEYVLYVSNIDVYKAQLEVVQAWKLYKDRKVGRIKLLLVGSEYKPYAKKVRKLINSLNLQNEVILMGHVQRDMLPSLYENSLLNIYASSCENCPNILLEILASGSPVLCSNYQPMPEIGGGELIYFDPYNPKELSDKLISALSSSTLREEMGINSRKRAKKFSWKKTASETWSYIINA